MCIAGDSQAKDKELVLSPVGKAYAVSGNLSAKKDDNGDAYDISGIACLPPETSGKRHCLVVNDESRHAQVVTIKDGTITPGKLVKLNGKSPSDDTLGTRPAAGCPNPPKDPDKLGEFDGEGVSYAPPYFYVVGSHGCSRKRGTFPLGSMMLARIPVDEDGEIADEAETTYRLGDALAAADPVKTHYLKSLGERDNGLNIEGIAVVGGRLVAGLRAPSLNGTAYLVSVPVDDLFAKGHARLAGEPKVIPLKVGEGAGIRDIAPWEPSDDTRLLVLTGPAQEQPGVPSRLSIAELPSGRLIPIGMLDDLDDPERCGKAEAAMMIRPDRALVLFDGLPNGGAREYEIKR